MIRQTNWWQLGGKKPSLYATASAGAGWTTGPLEFREDRVDLQGKVKTALPA